MELAIYQMVFLLTTLFSGSDARPAASRQNAVLLPKQSDEYPRIAQAEKLHDHLSSRQGMLYEKHLLAVEKELQAKIYRLGVIKRLKRTRQLRTEFFFPSETGYVSQAGERPHVEIAQKPRDYLGDLSRRKAAAKFKKLRRGKRYRRYVKQGSKWVHDTITWTIPSSGWCSSVSNSDVKSTLEKAFRLWAEVSPLKFRWVDSTGSADITIKFATGNHGSYPDDAFDGPGQILAHAFYPDESGSLAGDIHFDDDETWTVSPSANNNDKQLLPVAVHEIGHSLGLKHSSAPGAIMNTYYSDQNNDVILSDDDVLGIQDIYGLCDPRMTAIESWMGDYKTYIFKGDQFWRFNDGKNESDRGYPLKINSTWGKVPDNIDEIFLWAPGWKFYFFKGSQYYRYNDGAKEVDTGYPKSVSTGWPGLPSDGIDAAFTWSDGISYFFKGDQVYKYDNVNDEVESGYPKNMSDDWPGIPENLDSAFRWYINGLTYFFKDEFYWKWNDGYKNASGPFLIRDGWKNICDV